MRERQVFAHQNSDDCVSTALSSTVKQTIRGIENPAGGDFSRIATLTLVPTRDGATGEVESALLWQAGLGG